MTTQGRKSKAKQKRLNRLLRMSSLKCSFVSW